jgi:hypothetical protein
VPGHTGSAADDKSESGVRLDMIGYTIRLPENRVLISRKNFLTALHGFISTDVTKRINLRAAQRLASFGTRCGKICRVMRPFCGALYRVTWGRVDEHAIFPLSTEAIIAIQCWRAMLCLVRFREKEFTRTIESFAPATPILVAEFDSSLSGAGLIWSVRTNGTEVVRGVSAVNLDFLGFGTDSSNQNLAEYIGAILAVLGQVILGFSGTGIALRGDSVTALTWAMTERPRGMRVTNASMIWTLLCIAADVDVKEVTHIAGEDNKQCDRLSRRWDIGKVPTMTVSEEAEDMGLRGVNVVAMDADSSVRGVVELCDPRTELSTESQFISFWMRAKSAIDTFMSMHNRTRQQWRATITLLLPLPYFSLYPPHYQSVDVRQERTTVMTAAGVLRTTVLDAGRAVVGNRSQGSGAQTSSSTGGAVWVKPGAGQAQEGGAKTSSSTGGPIWGGPEGQR